MLPSEALKSHVKWLKDRCKSIKKEIDEYGTLGWYDDGQEKYRLEVKLAECVAIKVSTEKYMKLLRHQGN